MNHNQCQLLVKGSQSFIVKLHIQNSKGRINLTDVLEMYPLQEDSFLKLMVSILVDFVLFYCQSVKANTFQKSVHTYY